MEESFTTEQMYEFTQMCINEHRKPNVLALLRYKEIKRREIMDLLEKKRAEKKHSVAHKNNS